MDNKKVENILYFFASLIIFVLVWTAFDWLWCKVITHNTFTFAWQRTLGIGVVVSLVFTMSRARSNKKKEIKDKK